MLQGAGSPFGRPTECRRPCGCSEPLVQSSARDSAARPPAQQLRAGRGRVGESVEVTSAELLSLVYISSACKLFLKTFQHVLGLSGARVGRACNSVGFPLAGIDHSPSPHPSSSPFSLPSAAPKQLLITLTASGISLSPTWPIMVFVRPLVSQRSMWRRIVSPVRQRQTI